MSLVEFSNLNLDSINKEDVKIITFNDIEIEVKQYLSINDKYDLIMSTLQKSEERGVYNPLKLDMYFNLNLVYLYTNISFAPQERFDETEIYDKLNRSGLLDAIIKEIPEDDYRTLQDYVIELYQLIMKYRNTAGAVLQSFVQDLPKNAEAAKKVVDDFDPEKFKKVLEFATAANGGRPIFSN